MVTYLSDERECNEFVRFSSSHTAHHNNKRSILTPKLFLNPEHAAYFEKYVAQILDSLLSISLFSF